MKAVCLISGGMDSLHPCVPGKEQRLRYPRPPRKLRPADGEQGTGLRKKDRRAARGAGLYRDRPPVFPAVRGEQPDRPNDRGRPVRPGPGARPQYLRPVPERKPPCHRDQFCRGKRGGCDLYRRAGARLFRYPDCRPAFIDAFRRVIDAWNTGDLAYRTLHTLHPHDKDGYPEVGKELHVPYEHTWSCYQNEEEACGTCGSCHFRREAFAALGMTDPIPYKVE